MTEQLLVPGVRRRRDSRVFDAERREVFITYPCQGPCRKVQPLRNFGLRKMGDGKIRSIPWCRRCRAKSGPTRGDQD